MLKNIILALLLLLFIFSCTTYREITYPNGKFVTISPVIPKGYRSVGYIKTTRFFLFPPNENDAKALIGGALNEMGYDGIVGLDIQYEIVPVFGFMTVVVNGEALVKK